MFIWLSKLSISTDLGQGLERVGGDGVGDRIGLEVGCDLFDLGLDAVVFQEFAF